MPRGNLIRKDYGEIIFVKDEDGCFEMSEYDKSPCDGKIIPYHKSKLDERYEEFQKQKEQYHKTAMDEMWDKRNSIIGDVETKVFFEQPKHEDNFWNDYKVIEFVTTIKMKNCSVADLNDFKKSYEKYQKKSKEYFAELNKFYEEQKNNSDKVDCDYEITAYKFEGEIFRYERTDTRCEGDYWYVNSNRQWLGSKEGVEIYSVKRFSDNLEFFVGDQITGYGKIARFELWGDVMMAMCDIIRTSSRELNVVGIRLHELLKKKKQESNPDYERYKKLRDTFSVNEHREDTKGYVIISYSNRQKDVLSAIQCEIFKDKSHLEIYRVKRLSDNLEFVVNEITEEGKIDRFYVLENLMYANVENDVVMVSEITKKKEKQALFTIDDIIDFISKDRSTAAAEVWKNMRNHFVELAKQKS